MIKIAFLTLMVLFGPAVISQAQTIAWDSTHRPASYKLKVDQFKAYPNSSKDFIFLGNSLTANTDWTELLGIPNAKNRGISGDITFGVLERLNEVTEGQPAKVFILIGINDISRNIPDEVIIRNYHRIITQLKTGSPRTKIYVQTLLPTNETFKKFPNHYGKEVHILAVNKALIEMAAKAGFTLINLYTPYLDNEKKLKKAFTHDGLHLTPQGYTKWAEILKNGNYLK